MNNELYILLFIFAGVSWAGLLLLFLVVYIGLQRTPTPKPTDHEKEWQALERNIQG